MISIAQNPSYTLPVTANLPSDDGKTTPVKFTLKVKRLTQQEIESVHERIKDGTLNDEKLCKEVIVGWGADVQDENKEPLLFNDDNLQELLSIYPVRPTVVNAFFASLDKAKAKN